LEAVRQKLGTSCLHLCSAPRADW